MFWRQAPNQVLSTDDLASVQTHDSVSAHTASNVIYTEESPFRASLTVI